MAAFERVRLGDLRPPVARLGLGSSYGLGARGVARAFDRGLNCFYWGSLRRASFGEGVRDLAATHRGEMAIIVQSYTRMASLLRWSLARALKALRTDHADILLLGMWNGPVPERIMRAAESCVRDGLARGIMVSCHRRTTFVRHAADPRVGAIMTRYNAAHPGAETDVFPHLPARPLGVVAYTATCWGRLLDRSLVPQALPLPRASDCYRFALSHPSVHLTFCGPRDTRDLDEALCALDRGPMDADEIAWMKRVGDAVR